MSGLSLPVHAESDPASGSRSGAPARLAVEARPDPGVTRNDPPAEHSVLVERIRRGDEAAFESLFRAYYTPLCDFVAGRIGAYEPAVELVQEVFISVWERRITLDPVRPINRYLFRAARNRALDFLKHQRVETRSHGQVLSMPRTSPMTPEEHLRLDEISLAARQAIDDLPSRCRQIFLLSREGDLTYRQIADALDISIKSVETQMGRALRALRAALSTYLG